MSGHTSTIARTTTKTIVCKGQVGKGENQRRCTRAAKTDSKFCWQHTTSAPPEEISVEVPSVAIVPKKEKKSRRTRVEPEVEVEDEISSKPHSPEPTPVPPKKIRVHKNEASSNGFGPDAFLAGAATDEMLEFFGDSEMYQNLQTRLQEVVGSETPEEKECPHENLLEVEAEAIFVCKDCGCTVENLDFRPEWRNYPSDSRSGRDGSRCHRSKASTKGGIETVFVECKLQSIPLAVRAKTETKYRKVVKGETVRGQGRKSIVAACLMYTYRDEGDLRCANTIQRMFGISRKEMTKGITLYLAAFPEERVKILSPRDLLFATIKKIGIDVSHYRTLVRISKCLEGVDATLNRSSPQSVAAAIVYLYLCLNPALKKSLDLTKTKFAKQVDVSDITIGKLVKRSVEILCLEGVENI